VNLGCGTRFHPRWINLDISPQSADVIQADFSRSIPLETDSVDVVYHAAVIEHIRRSDAHAFLAECRRILRTNGVLRVGFPDLETIVRIYLEKLSLALAGDADAKADYNWIMLELVDQMVREQSGGEMLAFLRQTSIPNEEFIIGRIGDEGRHLIDMLKKSGEATAVVDSVSPRPRAKLDSIGTKIRTRLARMLMRDDDLRALALGRFRLGGEVHQWMYDRFSISELLNAAGFINADFHTARTSGIPGWANFYLDVTPDGRIVKPDLLFAEARKVEPQIA
jgi:SAM-dependent methyltransferase